MSDDSDPPADALTAALAELWLLPRPRSDNAYFANRVDELLGHLTAIEAAFGLQADYDRRLRPNSDKGPGATRRVAARIAVLLGGTCFADQYERLFQVRSAFLHGRAMGAISTA